MLRTARPMRRRSARAVALSVPTILATVVATIAALATPAAANVAVTQVSSDPFTDTQAQHQTQVEPDTYAFGSTIVSTFQSGRVFGGGSSGIGFSTSTDGGATWTRGVLPGITANTGGPYGQASDPSVAFDARDNVWLISSLGISGNTVDVLTSRSTDGGLTWSNPVTTATGSLDKNWIVCDNTATSAFFGHCYTEYDVPGSGDAIQLKTSTDGGLTWGPARTPTGNPAGLGGQPVVRPNGTVIMPYLSTSDNIQSFRSTDGGTVWQASVVVATISHHTVAGGLREEPLPSAEIDGAGTVYVAWADCRFRTGCTSNDIVFSRSTGETTWGAVTRVPIDPITSTVDHFIPGFGVDRTTSGDTALIGLTYFFYPTAACTAATCQLNAGFISSTDGGADWSAATPLVGPMSLSWLPNTNQGRMLGDYISTSVLAGGTAYSVIPVAFAPSGSTFNQSMNVPTGGLAVTGGAARAVSTGVVAAAAGAAAGAVPRMIH